MYFHKVFLPFFESSLKIFNNCIPTKAEIDEKRKCKDAVNKYLQQLLNDLILHLQLHLEGVNILEV